MKNILYILMLFMFSGYSYADIFDCNSSQTLDELVKYSRDHALYIGNGVGRETINEFPVTYIYFGNAEKLRKNLLYCRYRAEIAVPEKLLQFIKEYYNEDDEETEKMYRNIGIYSLRNDMSSDRIMIDKLYALITITDDHKDIVVIGTRPSTVNDIINAVAWFKINQKRLADGLPELRYKKARFRYKYLDGQLNAQWNTLSSLVKKKMKKDALKWISLKDKTCGDINLVRSSTLSIEEKTEVYKCHSRMTENRLDSLDFSYQRNRVY